MSEKEMAGALSGHEEFLARTFEAWRDEFRGILEDHRLYIQDQLERIEREIEKKSDKENVDVQMRGIHDELHRHTEEINRLHARVGNKMGSETMWKIVGLILTLGGAIGGLMGFLINLLLRTKS